MDILCKILWAFASILLLGGGIYFSFLLKFPQFQFKKMSSSFKKNNKGISPFETLCISLAARIGVGSLAGIALAICYGGIGSVFWICLTSLILMSNTFVESVLGVIYREKIGDEYVGGPAYYISKGLKNKTLAKFYAFLIILAYIVGFLTIQANTIVVAIKSFIEIDVLVVSVFIIIFSALSIINGLKSISYVIGKLVPLMGLIFIGSTLFIIFNNIMVLPLVFFDILKSAFNFKSFFSGFLYTLIVGLQRGVFSTESGLGSGAIASGTSNDSNPYKQGYVQTAGIYLTVFLVCLSVSLIIITSPYQSVLNSNINGIEVTQRALTYHLGSLGNYILLFSIISFAFSTIIAGYYYGESNLRYLKPSLNKRELLVFKVFVLFLLFLGCVVDAGIIWNIIDTFVALLAIVNMFSLLQMHGKIKKWNDDIRNKIK